MRRLTACLLLLLRLCGRGRWQLRHNIISWTRFHEEHNDDNLLKKKMIDELPPALQRGLVSRRLPSAASCSVCQPALPLPGLPACQPPLVRGRQTCRGVRVCASCARSLVFHPYRCSSLLISPLLIHSDRIVGI